MDADTYCLEQEKPLDDDLHFEPYPNFESHPNLESHPVEDVAERLSQSAAKGEWNEVRNICQKDWLLDVPITKLGGTVLHLAAYHNLEDIFELLLQQLASGSLLTESYLKRKNFKGNTPLHYAASVGSVRMCHSIIDKADSTTLLSVRNNEGETPLFSAVLHGHKKAFLYLDSICCPEEISNYWTRKNDDTILLCAISEEHYELSLIILRKYKALVNLGNKDGMTPLHLLASKPSAFKSGNDLRWFENIIYHSFAITDEQELFLEADEENLETPQVTHGGHRSTNEATGKQLPPNYRTCFQLVEPVYKAVSSVYAFSKKNARNAVKEVDTENPERAQGAQRNEHQLQLPPNYSSCFLFVKLVFKAVQCIFEPLELVRKVRMTKVRHTWSILIMNELLKNTSMYQYSSVRKSLNNKHGKEKNEKEKADIDLPAEPILIAAKNGITEMVEKIIEIYPVAMYDVDKDQKNIVLLTVEYKQPSVYELLLSLREKNVIKDSVFTEVDHEGNSTLHLAATKAEFNWPVPGAASQMQWEIRWYEYIKNSMKRGFLPLLNKNGQTPEEVFTKNHEDLVKEGGNWLISTSDACSVVAGLFVSITFSTATALPDGIEGNKHSNASKIFAGSSFVSFYSSLLAVVMFLAILTSGCRERDFRHALPWKLLLGLTAFYVSIASTLVSFTTGHFFIFRDQLKFVSSTSYIVAYLLVTLFSMGVFPLYFHLAWATLKKVPQRKYRVNIPHWLLED
ncbi:hypothetical protein RGQ29_009089 [Quercus rubra]|uniref:PGG domain-containing protein n=1 Tax=Quercus rubra TaxID=3512 RepID=A0AAN7I078_QUERU|nr:hypothetical protein RGQ29_009089 [Quercus rubra]